MNLDDTSRFEQLDPQDMLGAINDLPDQLDRAWNLGKALDLAGIGQVNRIVACGMGGSAIGADLLSSYVAPLARVPVIVWRNYDLPAFARTPDSLVIASSHSGNTEETLSGFEAALDSGAQALAITTGGKLAERAEEAGVPVWRFDHSGQPRAAVGYSFGMLLAVLAKLDLIDDQSDPIEHAVETMRLQQQDLEADVPAVKNPSKRMAGQFVERWPVIIGAEILGPVARRWRTQIAELSKAVAQFEILPEMDHNMVAGVEAPEILFDKSMVVFLRAAAYHPRNLLRADISREIMMVEGFNTDSYTALGDSPLAQQWSALHYGDYVAYYLAMAYGIDPSPVRAIEDLKQRLKVA